ncbi:hypothetical protein ACLMJK_003857 [Lecanora helva]
MSAAVLPPPSTTGTLGFWNGTKDNQEGYVDYRDRSSNVNLAREVEVSLKNIRCLDKKPSFAEDGYELRKIPTSLTTEELLAANDPEGKARINDAVFAECAGILRQVLGDEPKILPTYFKVRQNREGEHSVSKMDNNAYNVRPYAHVDRDHNTISIPIHDAVGAEEAEVLTKKYRRWAQVNVWRPIRNNATKWPLAIMKHDQIPDWEYDSQIARIYSRNDNRTALRGVKAYDHIARYHPGYEYYYVSDMTPEEVLVFCSFDTDIKTVVPHSSFWDHNTPEGTPERASIEVRFVVFFDERKE